MPKRITITLSDDLAEAADLLRKRRRYRSASEYIQGLIRYDGQSQRDHHLTAEWAAFSPYERDALDAAILRQVKSGKGVRGSWLEARIEEIVKAHLAGGGKPATKDVAAELAKGIAEGAGG
jgi:Arc/MetJ-type ribon-helix-helix transcriptional regulator